MIGLVVDSIISINQNGELDESIYKKKTIVVVDKISGRIIYILPAGCELPATLSEIITFPDYVTMTPGFIDCHVHLTISKVILRKEN